MPLDATRYVRISKAPGNLIKNWSEGIDLARRSGRTLAELQAEVVLSRAKLSGHFFREANTLLRGSPKRARTAISRYYYSSYHLYRALNYAYHTGDDHEKHDRFADHLPDDLPSRADVQNWLR